MADADSEVVAAVSDELKAAGDEGEAAPARPEDLQAGAFSSRWAFWISAVGCSVGFGNIWRFPYLVYEYGGGAFFVPYILALFVVAIPITMGELGLGQLGRGGLGKAYRVLDKRASSVAFAGLNGFAVLMYYPLLLAWALMCLGYACRRWPPWMVSDAEELECLSVTSLNPDDCSSMPACEWDEVGGFCAPSVISKADYFFQELLYAKPDYWNGISRFNWPALICMIGCWTLSCLATIGGAKIIGYLNYFITAGPAVMMIVLLGVGCSLQGASIGLKEYLGKFDTSTWKRSGIWTDAASQSLFSMSATQGSMAGYSQYNPRDQNFVQDTYVIVIGDVIFAIISGLAVFAVIGFMSDSTGIPFEDLKLQGTGLAFQTYPVGLGVGIPSPGGQILTVIFFLTLWFMGMSSILGLIEGVTTIMQQSRAWTRRGFKNWHAYVALCSLFFLLNLMMCTDMGNYALDSVDVFINCFGFIFACGFQTIMLGWLSAFELYKERAGVAAVWTHLSTFAGGGALGAALGFGLPADTGKIVGPVVGAVVIIGGWAVAVGISNTTHPRTGEKFSLGSRFWNVMFYNVEQLRKWMNGVACKNSCYCVVPFVWSLCVKYITPLVAVILFFNACLNPYSMYKLPVDPSLPQGGPGEPNSPYQWWIFLWGNIVAYITAGGMTFFFFFPDWIACCMPEDDQIVEADYPDYQRDKPADAEEDDKPIQKMVEDFPASVAVANDASPATTTAATPPANVEATAEDGAPFVPSDA